MKIKYSKQVQVKEWITVSVSHKRKGFELSFILTDGKVEGTYLTNMATSYLTYFNEVPEKIRQQYFNQIKKHLEYTPVK